ncbi:helix-turn-helix domain-containing protein [Rhodococcus hoagii]|nr:helix-turn-helix domain-containing protein [Prescottella equi]
MIGMFSMLAEFEIDLRPNAPRRPRSGCGARSAHRPTPQAPPPPKPRRARELKAQGMTATEIGKVLGCSRATVYRYLSEVKIASSHARRIPSDWRDATARHFPSRSIVPRIRKIYGFPSHSDFTPGC